MRICDWSSDVCSSDLMPDIKLDKIIAEFRDHYTLIKQAPTKKFAHLDPEVNIPSKRSSSSAFMKRFLVSKKYKAISFLIMSIGALIFIFFLLKEDKGKKPVESLLHHKAPRSEEHTSELQSLMRNSYAVFCLQKKKKTLNNTY